MVKSMKNIFKMAGVALTASLLFSCSQDEDAGTVYSNEHPDSRYITLTADAGVEMGTRAVTAGYHQYDRTIDPTTMSGWGYMDGVVCAKLNNKKFANQLNDKTKFYWWNYDPNVDTNKEPWVENWTTEKYIFFAAMPYNSSSKLKRNNASSFSMTIKASGIANKEDNVLICKAPVERDKAGGKDPVPMQFDNVLSGYQVQFKLGEKMSKLRHFHITGVTVSGRVPNNSSYTVVYTKTGTTWNYKIQPPSTSITMAKKTKELIAASSSPVPSGTPNYYTPINSTEWRAFGQGYKDDDANTSVDFSSYYPSPAYFYLIPSIISDIRLEVTYDIYDEDGYMTRTSSNTIELSADNFDNLTTVMDSHAGLMHTINILIVPDHLYVLSDADQASGVLVVK